MHKYFVAINQYNFIITLFSYNELKFTLGINMKKQIKAFFNDFQPLASTSKN